MIRRRKSFHGRDLENVAHPAAVAFGFPDDDDDLTTALLSSSSLRSYSSENLNSLFGRQDAAAAAAGRIPMSSSSSLRSRSGSFSQPRTPTASSTPKRHHAAAATHSLSFHGLPGPGRSVSLGSTSVGNVTPGSATASSSGRTMREYDDGMRELKKENFNLKLRIYFLEERMGSSTSSAAVAKAGSKEELMNLNANLKLQVESLKYDVNEKSELLSEAGRAIEQLEARLECAAREREDDRVRLEDRLQQMQEELSDSSFLVVPDVAGRAEDYAASVPVPSDPLNVGAPPGAMSGSSGSESARDDDERLIREVDAEIARGLVVGAGGSPTKRAPPTSLPLEQSSSSSMLLTAVQEREEAEAMAGRLEELESRLEETSAELDEAERSLEESRQEVQRRLKDLISLESELVNRDIQISSLNEQLASSKDDLSQAALSHLSELRKAEEAKEEASKKAEECRSELERSKTQCEELCGQLEACRAELREREAQVLGLRDELGRKATATCCAPPLDPRRSPCPPLDGDATFSIHRHVPRQQQQHREDGRFQVVTQSLNVLPSVAVDATEEGETEEIDRLRRDMRKLKEYLRTSVQERKFLLKKIGTLNERIAERGGCGSNNNQQQQQQSHNSKYLLLRIANLQERLATSAQDADLLRSHLESLAEEMMSTKTISTRFRTLAAAAAKLVEDSKETAANLRRSASRTATPLVPDDEEDDGSAASSFDADDVVLPDPSFVDLDLGAATASFCRTAADRSRSAEAEMAEKDRLIEHQEALLEEYRREVAHCKRAATAGGRAGGGYDTASLRRRGGGTREDPGSLLLHRVGQQQYKAAAACSDVDDDSWSEPDVNAARKRMGITSQAGGAVSGRGAAESSETDLDKQRSFYSLEFHGASTKNSTPCKGSAAGKDAGGEDAVAAASSALDDDGALIFEDYSKIIEELRSHRREIEKLQSDFTAGSVPAATGREEASQGSPGQGFCSPRGPGSLECLREGLSFLSAVMDDLTYQIELSDSFDSGNGTDDEDDEDADTTEVEGDAAGHASSAAAAAGVDGGQFVPCQHCSKVAAQELGQCLNRCGALFRSSISAFRRLRRICCRLRARNVRADEALSTQGHALSQLEETVAHLRREAGASAAAADTLQSALHGAREELNKRAQELQDAQVKINDNYKLMSEISSENLRLAGEKVRMEELLDEVRGSTSARRRGQHQGGGRSGGGGGGGTDQQQQHQQAADPSVPPPRSVSACPASSAGAAASTSECQPQQRSHSRHRHRNQHRQRQGGWRGHGGKRTATTTGTRERGAESSSEVAATGPPPTNAGQANPADISSPDLGVDVSSDPAATHASASSLERAKGYISESLNRRNDPPPPFARHRHRHHHYHHHHPHHHDDQPPTLDSGGGGGGGGRVETMIVENRQLRHERDLLMQKLVRSKGALKETLDRLATSPAAAGASRGARARVTSDLVEFSRTYGGGGGSRSRKGGGSEDR